MTEQVNFLALAVWKSERAPFGHTSVVCVQGDSRQERHYNAIKKIQDWARGNAAITGEVAQLYGLDLSRLTPLQEANIMKAVRLGFINDVINHPFSIFAGRVVMGATNCRP